MKRTIRFNVFETNSSSTHSICICTKEEYEDFKNGKYYYDDYEDTLVPSNSVTIESDEDEWQYLTFKDFWDDDYLDGYKKEFTSPSGDKMVAFGKYGHD